MSHCLLNHDAPYRSRAVAIMLGLPTLAIWAIYIAAGVWAFSL